MLLIMVTLWRIKNETKYYMFRNNLYVSLLFTIISLLSCDTIAPKDFNTFATKFVADYRQLFPDESPLSMDNELLGRLPIPTPTYLDSVRDFHRAYAAELAEFDRSILPPVTRIIGIQNTSKTKQHIETLWILGIIRCKRANSFEDIFHFLHVFQGDRW